MPGPHPHMGEDPAHELLVEMLLGGDRDVVFVPDEFDNPGRKLLHRQNEICKARCDGAARHGWIFGLAWILDENDTARFFHLLYPRRAVRPGSRENDCETVAVLFCKGAEEQIDWRPLSAGLFKLGCGYVPVGEIQPAAWRNHIDVVCLELLCPPDLHHRHAGARRQDVREFAMNLRIKMHHHDKSGAWVIRKSVKEGLQGADAARGRPDANNDRLFIVLLRSSAGGLFLVVHGQAPVFLLAPAIDGKVDHTSFTYNEVMFARTGGMEMGTRLAVFTRKQHGRGLSAPAPRLNRTNGSSLRAETGLG